MAKRTTRTDPRTDQLVEECMRQAGLLNRFPDETARGKYRAGLAGMTLPELEKERGQLELAIRRRYTATSETLLRSAGPSVLTLFLRGCGLRVFIRRVDLLELAVAGVAIPEPLTARVMEIVGSEGKPTEEAMAPREMAMTIGALRAIACAACVQPPDAYFEDPDFDVDDIDSRVLKPQFAPPGVPCGPGQLPVWVNEDEPREDGWRGLRTDDLKEIAQAVVTNGPGALAAFRLRQESLVASVHGDGGNGRANQ